MKAENHQNPPQSGFFISALFGMIALWGIPATGIAGDSAAGDQVLAHAMESLSRGTLASAREAVTQLSDGALTNPLYRKLRGEIEIFFRAEYAIESSQAATEEAKTIAEQKRRSMKLALEPSKLTGRNDPAAAARYRKEAEAIMAKARAEEARAKRNFLLALQRIDDLATEMIGDGEEAVAFALGKAILVVTGRNEAYLTAEDGAVFRPALTESKLDDLRIQVTVRQAWVRQGLEKEKAGDNAGALELYKKAGFEAGIKRPLETRAVLRSKLALNRV